MARRPNICKVPADPLIDELRAIRAKLAAQFRDDLDGLWAHLAAIEQRYPDRLVTHKPAVDPAPSRALPRTKPRRPAPPLRDPLIDEVRAARAQVWEDAGGTWDGLLADLRKIEKRYGGRLVSPPQSRRSRKTA